MEQKREWMTLVALLLLSVAMNFAIHYAYPLPIHSDEYDHLAIVGEMERTGGHVWYDPYTTEKRHAQRNLEFNYDVWLYAFVALAGLPLEAVPLVLPALFSFLMATASYWLVRYLTHRELAALFAGFFVFFLPNSIAFLGYWFLVPMALGLAMAPVMLYLFLRGLGSWRYAALFYLGLINLALTHAVYVTVLLPAMGLYWLTSPGEWKKSWAKGVVGVGVLMWLTTWFVAWDWGNLVATVEAIVAFLVWPYGTHTASYPLADYVGTFTAFLAAAGTLYLAMPLLGKYVKALQQRFAASTRGQSLQRNKLLIFYLVSLVVVRLYADYSGVCLLGPCRRTQPALTVMALVVAGIGFYAFVNFLNKVFLRVSERRLKVMRAALFLLVLAFLAHQLMVKPFKYANDPVRGLYHNVELEEQPALDWMAGYLGKNDKVMALPWAAKAVHVMTRRKVVDTGAARLGRGLAELKDLTEFYLMDCDAKFAVLERRGPDAVYAGKGTANCEFLDQVYDAGGVYVYVPNG